MTVWDKLRLLGLAVMGVVAIRQWLVTSNRRRGQQLTRKLLIRILTSAGTGVVVSLIAVGFAYHSHDDWFSLPMMPGFFIGMMTVGVHRDDNALMYVTAFANTAFYGAIAFVIYPLVFAGNRSDLP